MRDSSIPLVSPVDGKNIISPKQKRTRRFSVLMILIGLVLIGAGVTLLVLLTRSNPSDLSQRQVQQSPVWPLPWNVSSYSSEVFILDPANFAITTASTSARLLSTIARYHGKAWIFDNEWTDSFTTSSSFDLVSRLNVVVLSKNETLDLRVDESYSLDVSAPEATLTANTIYGAVRGLETFAQLIQRAPGGASYSIEAVVIADKPRLPYRGILVDVARNFILPSRLHQILDSMAVNKLNVLLLHLSDDQSFPFASVTHPNLTHPLGPGLVYSHEDLISLNDHANQLGIMIQAELDMPAHAASWYGEPSLLICNDKPGSGLLNPALDYTWKVITDISNELRGIFSFATLDLGGDEVATYCWQNSPSVMAFQTQHNISDLVCYFHERQAAAAVDGGYHHFAMWEDARGCYGVQAIAPDALIDVWDQSGKDFWRLYDVPDVVKDGWTNILVSSGCYFLNHFEWENNYLCDVQNVSTITPEQRNFIIGGHGSRWGEETTTAKWFNDSFPGLASVAEKLWSAPDQTVPSQEVLAQAGARLRAFVCRMERLGLGPFDTVFGNWPFDWCS